MELLKLRRRKNSKLSDVAYIGLNLVLSVAILFAVLSFGTPWVALVLAVVSKWRIFAVKPRFWAANVLANMVDVIVGISHVLMLYGAMGVLPVQIGLTVLYAVWLLFIKPRSKRVFVALQAGVAVFYGVTALSYVAYGTWQVVFVLGMWAIGFSAARHVLMSYDDESYVKFYSLLWSFVFAQLGWLGYYWLFAYTLLQGAAMIRLVQLAIISTIISFAAFMVFDSHHRNGEVKKAEIVMPVVFSALLIAVLLLFFNALKVNTLS